MTPKNPESRSPKLLSPLSLLIFVTTVLAGGVASAALVHRLVDGGAGFSYLALFLGAFFSGLGWSLPETIVETIVFLLITCVMGGVALVFFQSEMLRVAVIAFVSGFNIGKLAGGVYRELGG